MCPAAADPRSTTETETDPCNPPYPGKPCSGCLIPGSGYVFSTDAASCMDDGKVNCFPETPPPPTCANTGCAGNCLMGDRCFTVAQLAEENLACTGLPVGGTICAGSDTNDDPAETDAAE